MIHTHVYTSIVLLSIQLILLKNSNGDHDSLTKFGTELEGYAFIDNKKIKNIKIKSPKAYFDVTWNINY